MPVYGNTALLDDMPNELKKRMQGKACFNFKTDPGPELIADLKRLTAAGFTMWKEKKWL
jgi:hypothetical protein